jgi:hypothetical protein
VPQDNAAVTEWSAAVTIEKTDAEERIVFGWLYQSTTKSGEPVVDHSGETVEIHELEKAAYGFVRDSRKAGHMHERDANGEAIGIGTLVECMVFTPEKCAHLGIPEGVMPAGIWVGFKIDDEEAWQGVKSGRLKMLSFGGTAIKQALGA